MNSIRLSEKHGVNPGVENCFICGEPKGVVLYGEMTNKIREALTKAGVSPDADGKASHRGIVLDKEPCDKCKGYMKQGVILISVREPKSEDEEQNPYRTGGWVVVKDKFIKRTVSPPELCAAILKERKAFVPDEAWDMLGLPRGSTEGISDGREQKAGQ